MGSSKKFEFLGKIYQTGINWCVDVPTNLTEQMTAEKGRINIKGRINGFHFTKTLMTVKNSAYRLFVNGMMMKGGKTTLGEVVTFEIEQDTNKVVKEYPMPVKLVEQLDNFPTDKY